MRQVVTEKKITVDRLKLIFANTKICLIDLSGTLIHFDDSRFPKMMFEGEIFKPISPDVFEKVKLIDNSITHRQFLSEFRYAQNNLSPRKKPAFTELSANLLFEVMLLRLTTLNKTQIVEVAAQLAAINAEAVARSAYLDDNALNLLTRLGEMYPLILITNFDLSSTVDKILDMTGTTFFFDKVVISEFFGFCKPHERIFREAIESYNLAPHEITVIGDDVLTDVWGAKRIGLNSIWLNNNHMSYPFKVGCQPDLTVENLAELENLIIEALGV